MKGNDIDKWEKFLWKTEKRGKKENLEEIYMKEWKGHRCSNAIEIVNYRSLLQ